MTTSVAAPAFTAAPLWYLTRGTAIVSFILLTASIAFGVAATRRAARNHLWPRFVTQALHRNVSLLALALLVAHILTTVLDGYVNVDWISVVVPFTSSYHRYPLGLGTIAFDILVLVIATSLVRLRFPQRLWRLIHLSVYLVWPVSLLHFLQLGTDAKGGAFGRWLAVGCGAAVTAAVLVRFATLDRPLPVLRLRRPALLQRG
jgi:sulfoxide reductase heme-binding subunit YedZ